jgi:hypothetical protein
MGKSSREIRNNNNNPGPGNYDINSKLSGSSYIMKKDNSEYAHDKLTKNINKTPAPGNYDPNYSIKFNNIAYSMRPKINPKFKNNNPGPGAYDNDFKKTNSPLYS